jgi:hypothetical protein
MLGYEFKFLYASQQRRVAYFELPMGPVMYSALLEKAGLIPVARSRIFHR